MGFLVTNERTRTGKPAYGETGKQICDPCSFRFDAQAPATCKTLRGGGRKPQAEVCCVVLVCIHILVLKGAEKWVGLSAAVGWRRSWMTCLMHGSASMSQSPGKLPINPPQGVQSRGVRPGWPSKSIIPYAVRLLLPCTVADGWGPSQLIRDTMTIVPLLVLPILEDLRNNWRQSGIPCANRPLLLSLFFSLAQVNGTRINPSAPRKSSQLFSFLVSRLR